jgi:membrane fusion protein (multidrug efflux system)
LSDAANGEKANGGGDKGPGKLARTLRWPLMIGGPVVILAVVLWFVLTGGRYQSTDDSYVQVARVPVSTSVAGRVVEVDVKENQPVQAGQVLFKLDPRDYQAALEQAEAALATAKSQVMTGQAGYSQQVAAIKAADETVAYSEREAVREKALADAGVVSRQQADQAQHAADQARAQAQVVRQQAAGALAALGGAPNQSPDVYATVLQAKAMVDKAKLNLSYTVITAPQAGTVTRVDQLQPGAYVNASQPLFWLVSGEPWIEANFKENQLAKMHVGQSAEIEIDAYKGQKFPAHVASFSPGTGSTFSVLPAQNATGNWVKVVQRLAVRLTFDRPPPDMAAHAGLSAKVKVDTRSAARTAPAGKR